MQLRIECPICESQFQIDRESPPVMSTCPECKRQFKTTNALDVTGEKTKREKLIVPEQVIAKTPSRDSQSPEAGPSAPVAPDYIQPEAASIAGVPVKPAKRTYAKRPRKTFPLAVIGVLVMVAVALLVYLPIVVNRTGNADSILDVAVPRPDSDIALDPDETTAGPVDQNDDPARQATTSSGATKSVLAGFADQEQELEEPQQEKRTPKPAPQYTPEFFTEIQLEDCWREHHSRLVRLKIATAMGEHLGLGTIVDSRGWLVTSYRAVAGATQILVTQSSSSFEQFERGEALSDNVRGVLAVDIENDLAVLAINRRFVLNFSDLKIATEDTVNDTDHLIQFGLIDEDTPLILRETGVTARPKFTELDSQAIEYFRGNRLDSESRRWILHTNQDGTIAGAPLITIEGQLVGLCTDQADSKFAYAIPLPGLAALIQSIETDPLTDGGKKPLDLSTLSDHLKEIGDADLSASTSVHVNNPYREMSVQFNRIGQTCAQFNWIPDSDNDYRQLQEFSRQLIEINDTINAISDDPDDADAQQNRKNRMKLEEQSVRWTDELEAAFIPQPVSSERGIQLNELALKALRSTTFDNGQPVYFLSYVRVRLGAMDSPKPTAGQDTLTLDIDQTNEILNVPYDDRFPTMRPDTVWLAIYTISRVGKISFSEPNSDNQLTARAAIITMVLGPL